VKKSVLIGVVTAGSMGAGFVACKARKSAQVLDDGGFANPSANFNDVLPDDFGQWDFEKKINTLWELNQKSPMHKPYNPDPKNTATIPNAINLINGNTKNFEDLKKNLPGLMKVAKFLADTADFATRPIDSIAALTVYTRLRDVYPKNVEVMGFNVKHNRATHPIGTLGKVKFNPKPGTKYTGMFQTGAIGLARASTATNPFVTDTMNRAVAIKFPVSGSYSRSLYAMHRIVGQTNGFTEGADPAFPTTETTDYRYFKSKKTLTNILPPPVGKLEESIANKFMDVIAFVAEKTKRDMTIYSKENLGDIISRLSVDNMAWSNQDGTDVANPVAPYRITLVGNPSLYMDKQKGEMLSPILTKQDWRPQLAEIPVGTVLWKVYGVDKENDKGRDGIVPKDANDGSADENFIGTITLEDNFKATEFANDEIMYKHYVSNLQTKEDLDKAFKLTGEAKIEDPASSIRDEVPAGFAENVLKDPSFRKCQPVDFNKPETEGGNPRKAKVFNDEFTRLRKEKDYDLVFVKTDTAPFCMETRNANRQGFPEELDGVWWMNGNPVGETIVTFANSDWDNNSKQLTLYPGGRYTWGYYASTAVIDGDVKRKVRPELSGLQTFHSNRNSKVVFDLKKGTGEAVKMKLLLGGWFAVPRFLADFSLLNAEGIEGAGAKGFKQLGVETFEDPNTIGDDTYYRRSSFLSGFKKGDYKLTRILDGNGKILTENYKAYLDAMARFQMSYTFFKRAGATLPKE
jgi:hypothetical protein